jgi:hypothetical protein
VHVLPKGRNLVELQEEIGRLLYSLIGARVIELEPAGFDPALMPMAPGPMAVERRPTAMVCRSAPHAVDPASIPQDIEGRRVTTVTDPEDAGERPYPASAAGHRIWPGHPLKVETRVRTPLGLRRSEAISAGYEGKWPRFGPAACTGPSRSPARFSAGSSGLGIVPFTPTISLASPVFPARSGPSTPTRLDDRRVSPR